jgi:ABC-type glycerol-3-phosphate transport system permease component
MAGMIISALPIVILFAALQRYFIQGLTGGAVKG